MLSYPANAALAQITAAMPIPARSSARSRPYGYRSVAGRRDSRKPRNTTALVDTSDRLWIGQRPRDPHNVPAWAGDDLEIHPMPAVLAGVERPVRGDAVDGN
jgi:hypothetical protein